MRCALAVVLLALTACSSQAPSGPTPSVPRSGPGATPPAARPLPFEGAYELSVSIAPECARLFPVALRVRRYRVRPFAHGDHTDLDILDERVADGMGVSGDEGWSTTGSVRADGQARIALTFTAYLPDSPESISIEAVSWDGDEYVPVVGAAVEGHLRGYVSQGSQPRACQSDRHDFYLRPV